MSIGETLAQARRWAGLTVTEVSQRTRIRETLVKDIERDDYSACGGDFYTRGHIRAIARVVGTDPEPLIEEYDAARRSTADTTPDLGQQFPPGGIRGWQQRGEPPTGPLGGTTRRLPPTGSPDWQHTGPPATTPPAAPPRTGEPRSGLLRTDSSRAGPPRSDQPRTGPRRTDTPGTGVPHDDPPRTGPPRTGQAGTGPRRNDPLGTEVPHDDPPRTGPWSPGAPRTGGLTGASSRVPLSSAGRAGPELLQRVSSALARGPQRGNWPVLFGLALLVTVGFLGYYFVYGSSSPSAPAPVAGNGGSTGSGQTSHAGGATHQAHLVVVHVTAVQASSVEFTTPGGKTLFRATVAAGSTRKWTFRGPVTMRVTNPGAVRLLVDGKNPLPRGSAARPVTLSLSPGRPPKVFAPSGTPTPASTPTPARPLLTSVPLTPVSATSFGPSGPGQGDNQPLAHLAIDRSHSTSWNTDWYASAHFGNLYSGTGLLLDMGRTVTITSAQITLGTAPGADLQLRVGNDPTMSGLADAARASNVSGAVRLGLSTPAHGRYVLIWFTKLPLNSGGNLEASVSNVAVEGRS
jgi:hypothetical protein